MSVDNMYAKYTLYGIHMNDWTTSFGGQIYYKHLVKDYIGLDCSVATSSVWSSSGYSWIYPHNIEKIYWLEGIIEGEITFHGIGQSCITNYQVDIFKINTDTIITTLATTGVKSVASTVPAHDFRTFHYSIDVTTSGKEISEEDRIGIKIYWNVLYKHPSLASARLCHDNDSTWKDLWVDLSFLGL